MNYPHRFKRDSAVVTLYRNKRADGYTTYVLSWYENRERRRRTFTDRAVAVGEAENLLTQILSGSPQLATLSKDDAKEYAVAKDLIRGTQLSLVTVVREYMRTWQPGFRQKTVRKVIEDFQKANADASPRYQGDLKYRLNAFKKDFGKRNIDEVGGGEVRQWIEQRTFKGQAVSKRTRSNWLRILRATWKFARKNGNLVKERRHALEDLDGWKFNRASYSFMSTAELGLLLSACDQHKGRDQLLPFLALQAFAGIRCSEAKRLSYEDLVIRDNKVVAVNLNANQTKTKTRRSIDALPVLSDMLHEFAVARHFTGKIAKWSKIDHILRRTAKEAGLNWRQNQLRHTFATHLLRTWSDSAKVALYLGTSSSMIDSHYKEIVAPAETEAWMGIRQVELMPIQRQEGVPENESPVAKLLRLHPAGIGKKGAVISDGGRFVIKGLMKGTSPSPQT